MLLSLRENIKGVTAAILVGLLIIPFAFFGVESLFVSGSSVEQAATVNGNKITRLEVERGLQFQKQRILSQFEDIDPALLDDERLRGPVLDQLIRQKLLATTGADEGMAVSDKTFNELVLSNDAFFTDGKFDDALYQYHLNRLGFTPLGYRENVKEEILANHVTLGIQASSFNTQAQLREFGELALQERTFDYVVLSQKDVKDQEVLPAEIEAYYQDNKEKLSEPDQVVVNYIELTPQLLASGITVEDSQINERVETLKRAGETEGKSWRLAHILVDPAGDGDPQQAVELISTRLDDGDTFAELAKEYSTDFGSAESGGELGTFTADALPPGFAEAIEGVETGEVAGPVELESGIHFIKVLDITEKAAAENISRSEAEAALKTEMAREKLPMVLERLKEETFSVDSLAPVGEKLGLPVHVSQPFSRNGGAGISRFPDVVSAAYSSDVLEDGFASQVIELEENHYVVIKLKDFVPSHVPPLEQVSDEISEIIRIQKAQSAVKKQGQQMLSSVEAGAEFDQVAEAAGLTVKTETGVTRFDQRVPQALSEAVFGLPVSGKLPATGMTTSLNGDVMIYKITDITAGSAETLSAEEQRSMNMSLAQLNGTREFQAYLAVLNANAEVKRSSQESTE